jgi:hypothetical protein
MNFPRVVGSFPARALRTLATKTTATATDQQLNLITIGISPFLLRGTDHDFSAGQQGD